MGTIPVWIKRTQTAGLIVTGAAIGYYYISPALRVEEVSLPANTLLAKARMFGTNGKKQAAIYDTQPYKDCFKVTVPKETLSRISSKHPEDLMLTYARSFLTSPVFKLERGLLKLWRVPDSLTDAQIESSDLQPGFRISAFEVAERTDKELLLRWLSERRTGEITAGYTWLGIAPSVRKAPTLRPLDQQDDSYWETVKSWIGMSSQSSAPQQAQQSSENEQSYWERMKGWVSSSSSSSSTSGRSDTSSTSQDTAPSYWQAAMSQIGLGPAETGPSTAAEHQTSPEEDLNGKSVKLMFGSAYWHVSPAGKVTAEKNQQVVSWPVTVHKFYSKLLLGSAVEQVEHRLREQ
ncbi:hypothetical protein ABBQ32_003151 [Trebouxia sp. C0010 RCD-2024]